MNPNLHLAEEDFDEILMGIPSPAVSAHLASCEPCGQRLANFQATFQSHLSAFNHASFAWSEARSSTISRNLATHKLTPRLTWSALCSSAAALVFTLALGLTVGIHHGAEAIETTTSSSPRASTAVDVEPSKQLGIADDNAMLAAIDSAIVTPQAARFGLYEPTDETAQPRRRSATRQVRD